MTTERLDAILDRLEALLEETDDPERRKDVREIQQLVIGVREDRKDERDPEAGGRDARDPGPADED